MGKFSNRRSAKREVMIYIYELIRTSENAPEARPQICVKLQAISEICKKMDWKDLQTTCEDFFHEYLTPAQGMGEDFMIGV